MAVVTLTTGVPGSGKTYVRASRFLVDYFLLEEDGHYYTNFPLNIEEIVEEVYSRQKIRSKFQQFFIKGDGLKSKEYFSSRIHIIPDYILQKWRLQQSGPWEFFEGIDLVGSHISIDEIHNFCKPSHDKEFLSQWDDFLGEVRHRGCTFEGITQDISSVSEVFLNRVSLRIELLPGEDRRDPYFKILMSDWYNLKAAFFGSFHKTVIQIEKIKSSGKWQVNRSTLFIIQPEYFRFYRSYEASLQEKQTSLITSSDRVPKNPYEKYTKLGLFFWFIRKNFLSLFIRLIIFFIVFWICFLGGAVSIFNMFIPSKSKNIKVEELKKDENSNSEQSGDSKDLFSKFYDQNIEGYLPAFFIQSKKLAILRNGTRIYKGFIFSSSTPLQGLSVDEINYSDRSYTLSSGHVFRLRFIPPNETNSRQEKK